MVKISIIIPVYNVENYLKDCLNSIINQSLSDIEIICVNDGSVDNSLNILQDYASKDNRFVIINQENCGQGIARNKALDVAKGKYISFVDPDDWIEDGALEDLYNFAESNNADVVQFDFRNYDDVFKDFKDVCLADNLKKIYKSDFSNLKVFNWRDFKDICLQNLDLHAWTRLYKNDFVKHYKLRFAPTKRAEDHLFVIGALLACDSIYYYKKCFYNYRNRANSTVNSKSRDNFQIFKILDLIKDLIVSFGYYVELENEFEIYKRTILEWHYKQTLPEDLDKYMEMCKQYLSDESLKIMMKNINKKRSFLENIFSLKNKRENGVKYKIITILGFSFSIPKK